MLRENEIWKEISGYENMYEVSSFGNVRSLDRKVFRNNQELFYKGNVMNSRLNRKGYKKVSLRKVENGKSVQKEFAVHRLVAIAFIDNVENKPQVNHINGMKTDNRVDNLEWCTASENMIHASKTGLRTYTTGQDVPWSKLTKAEVQQIKKEITANTPLKAISQIYGMSISAIDSIKRGTTWKEVQI